MESDENRVMFSRARGPNGKLDAEGKFKIDSETLDRYRRLCAEDGIDTSSDVRNYVYQLVYGHTYDELVARREQGLAWKRSEVVAARLGHIGAPDVPPDIPAFLRRDTDQASSDRSWIARGEFVVVNGVLKTKSQAGEGLEDGSQS